MQAGGSATNTKSYVNKKKMLADKWNVIRDKLIHVHTEELAPSTFTCCRCGIESQAIIRCLDCSNQAYYCQHCCDDIHRTVLFHVPSIWKGMMFVPYQTTCTPELRRPAHQDCNTAYHREVCLVDVKGVQHKAQIELCLCEEEAITILRYGFWPATPTKPKVLFHLDLMELAASLQLESGLSIKSFCDSLACIRRPQIYDVQEVKSVYRVLVGDCANEYRYHRTMFHQGRHLGLADVCCPACVKNASEHICVDGNFGLVHKINSGVGQGLESTRHKDAFFYNQKDVDTFVNTYKGNPKVTKDCSSFQAGDAIRSKVKNAKLDVTGVFGAVCQHDFPLKFCNLRHGERLAYAVFFMENFKPTTSAMKRVFMYDIACLLFKHLKLNKREDLLSDFIMAVPVFHSYAHNAQCQLQFGQRNVEATGLSDGEGTERLWSYLRMMTKTTKEMSLDNRHDMLVDCMYHYAMKLQSSFGDRTVNKYKRAVTLRDSTFEQLENFEIDGEKVLRDDIKRIHSERKQLISQPKSPGSVDINDSEEYCWQLQQEFDIRDKLETCQENSEAEKKFKVDLE